MAPGASPNPKLTVCEVGEQMHPLGPCIGLTMCRQHPSLGLAC